MSSSSPEVVRIKERLRSQIDTFTDIELKGTTQNPYLKMKCNSTYLEQVIAELEIFYRNENINGKKSNKTQSTGVEFKLDSHYVITFWTNTKTVAIQGREWNTSAIDHLASVIEVIYERSRTERGSGATSHTQGLTLPFEDFTNGMNNDHPTNTASLVVEYPEDRIHVYQCPDQQQAAVQNSLGTSYNQVAFTQPTYNQPASTTISQYPNQYQTSTAQSIPTNTVTREVPGVLPFSRTTNIDHSTVEVPTLFEDFMIGMKNELYSGKTTLVVEYPKDHIRVYQCPGGSLPIVHRQKGVLSQRGYGLEHAEFRMITDLRALFKAATIDQNNIKMFLSRSPCGFTTDNQNSHCTDELIQFVKDFPSLKIEIIVASLYYTLRPSYNNKGYFQDKNEDQRRALYELANHTQIKIRAFERNDWRDLTNLITIYNEHVQQTHECLATAIDARLKEDRLIKEDIQKILDEKKERVANKLAQLSIKK